MYVSAINTSLGLHSNKNGSSKNNLSVNPFHEEKGLTLLDSLEQLAKINNSTLSKMGSFSRVSFTGNKAKNLNQFAFLAPEDKAIGLNSMYSLGGLGVVTKEAGENWVEHGAEVRKFLPYHSFDNEGGLIKVLSMTKSQEPKFKSVETDYKLKKGENFVILQAPSNGKSEYIIIEDVKIEGSVKKITENLESEDIKYKIFKQMGTGEKGKPALYLIHTKEMAKLPAAYGVGANSGGAYGGGAYGGGAYGGGAYGGGAYGGGSGSFNDLSYSQTSRAFVDALPKFNTKTHGNYNPGNIWLHDRQAFHALVDLAEKSSSGEEYYHGLKAHATFHNPGRNYQGHYDNPLDFFRMVGSEDDLKRLQEHPDFDFVKQMSAKIQKEGKGMHGSLTEKEVEKLQGIFEPVIGKFKDQFGTYNICEIPIQSVKKNPLNTSAGTVSINYGNEMKNPNTPEIAEGLTKHIANIKTIDIVNGSTPANMKTNEIGDFGRAGNGFNTNEIKNGYTPFEVKLNAAGDDVLNIDEIYLAKQKNTEWITNTIAKATKKGKEGLGELFFTSDQIKPKTSGVAPANVLGGLSEYKKGDMLHISWGRPDPQKGLPTLFEAFLHFIKREDVAKEEKLNVKLLVGAGGPNPWDSNAADWKKIQELMKEIEKVDDGLYKNNACYVNGFFPNRLANACNGSDFTSVYEPCGITPLESFAAGNPVISNNTGGAPDFIRPVTRGKTITNETGFLTKNAYLVKPELIGADHKLTGEALNDARRIAIGKEVSDCIKDFADVVKDESQFKQMIKNVLLEKTDWHNNHNYNGGKSANERYFNEVFGVSEEFAAIETRNQKPMKNLKGKFTDVVTEVKAKITETTKQASETIEAMEKTIEKTIDKAKKSFLSTKTGKAVAIFASIIAIGAIAVVIEKRQAKKPQPLIKKA